MGIYTARPQLTDDEKRILGILAEALVDLPDDRSASNLPSERVPLSEEAAERLLDLLERYVASARFRARAQFVDEIAERGGTKLARELYLKGRTETGRTRAAASWQWGAFQLRLGIGRDIAPGSSGSYMDFAHFLRMEERLLRELQLHPRVRSLVLQMIVDRHKDIEAVRRGEKKLEPASVRHVPNPVIEELNAAKRGTGDHTLRSGRSSPLRL